MSRPIVLSNGSMSVGLNTFAQVHDFYYPHVGQENHAAGTALRHRIGVWTAEAFSWLDDGSWQFEFHISPNALIGYTRARHQKLGLIVEFEDCVDSELNVFLRNIHIVNERDTARDVRLFMHQAFVIGDSRSNTDTAQYLPANDVILHYRGRRAFVVGGQHTNRTPFDQYSIGLFGIEGHEGTFRDAEDGLLGNNTVEHGRVDSVIGFSMLLGAHSSDRVYYWVAAGKSVSEALDNDSFIRKSSVHSRIIATSKWWKMWLKPAEKSLNHLPKDYHASFLQSLMIIRSQIDSHGAVIASTDSTMLNYARDAYAYCWPRDGALVVWPLIRLGYKAEALNFFRFASRVLHKNGYLMHKFFADGSLGPSWHPYVHADGNAAPIQEDESAIVLYVFAQFFEKYGDASLLRQFYPSLVKPIADFLTSFVDPTTGLPKPSYDLWEEVYQTSTYTVAVVYAALLAAAEIADEYPSEADAVSWRAAAESIRAAAHKHLYNDERGYFYKGLLVKRDGSIQKDPIVDSSSLFGVITFGLFDRTSEQVVKGLEVYRNVLSPGTKFSGVARYEQDNYNRNSHSGVGNPWFINSLWLVQFYLSSSNTEQAREILSWILAQMPSTHMLAEQLDRVTLEPLSVSPLTWSHAEYVSTLLDMIGEQ